MALNQLASFVSSFASVMEKLVQTGFVVGAFFRGLIAGAIEILVRQLGSNRFWSVAVAWRTHAELAKAHLRSRLVQSNISLIEPPFGLFNFGGKSRCFRDLLFH